MTDCCHLCEEAERLLETVAAYQSMEWRPRDVVEDPEWMATYGGHIPVLADDAGHRLGWPFDATDLLQFLEAAR